MDNKEFENLKKILDKSEIPETEDIVKLFQDDFPDTVINNSNPDEINFEELGEAHDVKTFSGTEWVASRLLWNTSEGIICSINLFKKKIFDISKNDIIDIFPNELIGISFEDRLEVAIENEEFELAAKLRDWNKGLKKLLLRLKSKIIQALNDGDIDSLDEYMDEINDYRDLLWELN